MHTSRRVLLVRQAACVAAVLGLFLAILSSAARAQTASWAGGDAGGNWSVTTNWDPAGNPTAGQTATLGNVITGTRKVVYNTGANSGTLGSLVLTQTSAAVNELEVQRSLSITGGVTLGAAGGGTSRLFLDPAAAGASFTTTFSGGLTINAGGELRVRAVNLSGGTSLVNAQISGNVTVSGGSLIVAPLLKNGTNTGASQNDITGTLTMSSGTILLDNVNVSGESDRRLRVTGNVAITGGDIMANVAGAKLMLTGGSLSFSPSSFDATDIMIQLDGSNQTFAAGVVVNDMLLRGSGSWTKTISSTASGQNIGLIQIADGSATAAGGTFKLGSDLTLLSGRGMPAASGVGQTPDAGRIDLRVDADVYTLNLTSNTSLWTPNFSGASVTSATWTISGNGGRIIANGYNFAGTSITANVGGGLTLESKAGNSVANNLGGGTVNATSTFLYSGAAVAATPSTLTATATIGNVAVSSGALRLGSLGGIAGAATVSGGSLDLGSTTRTFTNVTLTGGWITAGTLATTGAYSLQAGTISAIVSGSQGVTKTTAGTVTLSGANTFTGVAAVNAGTLALGANAGLGGDTGAGTQKLSMGGGTLDLAGFSPTVFGVSGSGTITSASGGTLTIKVNNGATGATLAGSLNLATAAASGRSYQVLTAANTYTGTTTIAASTLLAIENVAGLGAGGAGQGTSVAGTLELKGPAATPFSVAEPLSISAGTVRTNAQSGTAGTTTLSGPIDLASGTATFEVNANAPLLRLSGAIGGSGGIAKTQAGTLEITSMSSYTGSTTISAGSLVVNGSLTGTSGLAVGTGTRLSGSGLIAAAISGAGLVSPGSSPGILTATQADPSGGLDYAFEFTATGSPTYGTAAASINDVLRLTDATTPFTTSLSAGNLIDVYFDVAALGAGDTFRGGFYTDLAGDFASAVSGATYAYWVKGNGSGTARTFNGQGYYSLTGFDPPPPA